MIRSMLINLKSKQRSEYLKIFEVPEELNGQSIGEECNQLQGKKKNKWCFKSIARMKSLEKDLLIKLLNGIMIKDNNTDELSIIRAKINIMFHFKMNKKQSKPQLKKLLM